MYNPQITVTRIKEKGKSENVSVSKLNEQCGLNKNTISASATSKMGLSAKILFDIADCLGCSVDYLLGRTDKPEGIEPAPAPTGDSLSDEMLTRFNSLDFADKAQVISLIAELSKKKT